MGGLLTDLFSYHKAMAIASAITLFGAVVAFFFLPETSRWRQAKVSNPRPGDELEHKPDVPQLISATALLAVNRLVIAGVLIATFGGYLAEKLGDSLDIGQLTLGVATITGIALGASTLIGMLAAPTAGRLSDKYKSRWRVASGGLTSGILGFSLLSLGTPLSMIAGLPLASISSGSNQSLSTALIGDLTPRIRHGRRLGAFFTVR